MLLEASGKAMQLVTTHNILLYRHSKSRPRIPPPRSTLLPLGSSSYSAEQGMQSGPAGIPVFVSLLGTRKKWFEPMAKDSTADTLYCKKKFRVMGKENVLCLNC